MAVIEKRRRKSDGKVSYRVKVRVKGHPPETATFDRRTDAVKWGELTQAAIKEGRHIKTSESKRKTVADLIDRYVLDVIPHKGRYGKRQAVMLAWWKAQIGAYALAGVTPALIVECRDRALRETTQSLSEKFCSRWQPM